MKFTNTRRIHLFASIFVPLALLLGGCNEKPKAGAPPSDATNASAEPAEKLNASNGSYVSMSGTITNTYPDSFLLDYGTGTIRVEVDDWDTIPEGGTFFADDDVIVYGYIDHDFFEKKKIEASSVYVRDLGTQFYFNGADEEDFPVAPQIAAVPTFVVEGTVGEVKKDEFVLKVAGAEIDVNVERMAYNPLDEEGYHRLKSGDHVSVWGSYGEDLFADLDLMATAIVSTHRGT